MIRAAVAAAPLICAACSLPLEVQEIALEHRSGEQRRSVSSAIPSSPVHVVVPGVAALLVDNRNDLITSGEQPFCDLVRRVLGAGRVEHTCTGAGTMSYDSAYARPLPEIVRGFLKSVVMLGGTVREENGHVVVHQGRRGVVVQGDEEATAVTGDLGAEWFDDGEIYLSEIGTVGIQRDVARLVRVSVQRSQSVYFTDRSLEDVEAAVELLGIETVVKSVGSRTAVSLAHYEWESLRELLSASGETRLRLSADGITPEYVDAVAEVFPAVKVIRMPDDTVWLSGPFTSTVELYRHLASRRGHGEQLRLDFQVYEARTEVIERYGLRELSYQPYRLPGATISALGDGPTVSADAAGVRVAFDALRRSGELRLLSRPSLLFRSGRSGRVVVGDQIPLNRVTLNEDGTRTTEIEFRDTGVVLAGSGRLLADGTLDVSVEVEVSQVSGSEEAPVISTRSIETSVLVADGQTVFLGSLKQVDGRKAGAGFAENLPLRFTSDATSAELVFLMTAERKGYRDQ